MSKRTVISNPAARFATLKALLAGIVLAYFNPPPAPDTFRDWLDKEKVGRIKQNPAARRGGGTVYYSVSDVEKMLKRRTLTCRLAAA